MFRIIVNERICVCDDICMGSWCKHDTIL